MKMYSKKVKVARRIKMSKPISLYDFCFTGGEKALITPTWSNVFHAFIDDDIGVTKDIKNEYLNKNVNSLTKDINNLNDDQKINICRLIYFNNHLEDVVYEQYIQKFQYEIKLSNDQLKWNKIQLLLKHNSLQYSEETITHLYQYSNHENLTINRVLQGLITLFRKSKGINTADISDFIDDIFLTIDDKIHQQELLNLFFKEITLEKEKFVHEFLKLENLDFSFKKAIISEQEFKLNRLEDFNTVIKKEDEETYESLFTELLKHNRVKPTWENITKYLNSEYCNKEVLTKYLESNAQKLGADPQKEMTYEQTDEYIIQNNTLSMESYKRLLDSVNLKANSIANINSSLEVEKIRYLIEKKILQLNKNTLATLQQKKNIMDDYTTIFHSWILENEPNPSIKDTIIEYLKSEQPSDISKIKLIKHYQDIIQKNEIIKIIEAFNNKVLSNALTGKGKKPTIDKMLIDHYLLDRFLALLEKKEIISSYKKEKDHYRIHQFRT